MSNYPDPWAGLPETDPYFEEAARRAKLNAKHLASLQALEDPKPFDPSKVTQAFEGEQNEKLASRLASSDPSIREQALRLLIDNARYETKCIKMRFQVIPELLEYGLSDKDSLCRGLSVQVVYQFCRHRSGRTYLLSSQVFGDLFPSVCTLITDTRVETRLTAHRLVLELCRDPGALRKCVTGGLTGQLIDALRDETDDACLAACAESLACCLVSETGWQDGMRAGVLDLMASRLSSVVERAPRKVVSPGERDLMMKKGANLSHEAERFLSEEDLQKLELERGGVSNGGEGAEEREGKQLPKDVMVGGDEYVCWASAVRWLCMCVVRIAGQTDNGVNGRKKAVEAGLPFCLWNALFVTHNHMGDAGIIKQSAKVAKACYSALMAVINALSLLTLVEKAITDSVKNQGHVRLFRVLSHCSAAIKAGKAGRTEFKQTSDSGTGGEEDGSVGPGWRLCTRRVRTMYTSRTRSGRGDGSGAVDLGDCVAAVAGLMHNLVVHPMGAKVGGGRGGSGWKAWVTLLTGMLQHYKKQKTTTEKDSNIQWDGVVCRRWGSKLIQRRHESITRVVDDLRKFIQFPV